MTPWEFFLRQKAWSEEQHIRVQLATMTGWYAAALSRTKRIPPLSRLTRRRRVSPSRRPQGTELEDLRVQHQRIVSDLASDLNVNEPKAADG